MHTARSAVYFFPGFVDLAVNDDKDIDSSPSVIEDMTEDATAPAEMPLQDQYLDMSTSIDENNRLTGLSPEMNLPHLDSVLADSLWPTGREDSWSMQPVPTSLQGAFPSLSEEDGFRELGIFDTTLNHKEQTPVAGPPQPSSRAHHASSPHVSIDDQADYSAQMIGFSNESDPFFLQHFPYNDVGELKFFRVVYRKPDILSSGIPNESSHSTPVHLLQSHNQTASLAIELTERCLSQNHDRERVQQLVDSTMGVALVRLYFRFVFESLPVLSRSCILQNESAFVETAPVGLLAAIYALALPFISFDEQFCLNNAYTKPSSDTLWQIAYANLQKELHFPKLATLQLCILLINHYPFDPVSVDTPFVWSMACSMLGIAQTLGLNVDPSAWNLPRWEIRLRRRLWWCVFVDHTWRSVTHGRALMISDDDWNVTHLDSSDFEMDLDSDVGRSPEYFFQLCRLTEIARRVVRQFYSLRAVSQPQSLERLIEQAREPRQQLLEWMNGLPQSLQMHMDGHAEDDYEGEDEDDSVQAQGSLHVAFFTVQILVLRTLLRPIVERRDQPTYAQSSTPSIEAILQACRGFMQTVIKFMRRLDGRHQSAFWPSYARHCLCYPGLFTYMLCLQPVQPRMAAHDQKLLGTWRRALQTRAQTWTLLRLAATKLDALFWKRIDPASKQQDLDQPTRAN
ncbi:unnamed protein product [Clonostachys rosea f. rosea IK726]|uniref:Uncharacterized protein n=1 Tax=Clonostachys rosea f. rosea IK726 TaxID=1349383 RepID=A0ACA9TYP8_BIOOC|nr:unnamed protein product [Clonostachys rosea f. rosea IK726]